MYKFENKEKTKLFSSFRHQVENLEEILKLEIEYYAKKFDVPIAEVSLGKQFRTLIESISAEGKPVVLLIDEYDKSITDFLTELEKAEKNQSVLRNFFLPLKDLV